MKIKRYVCLTLWCSVLMCSTSFCSPVRRALVVGNDSYPGNSLKNARNDARAVSEQLTTLGYASTLALDVDKRTMEEVIDGFLASVSSGDLVVVYYAGHGLEVDGSNYLVPVDFSAGDEARVKYQGYSLGRLLGGLTEHGVVTQIVILDSCRDNPFRGARSIGGGWASIGASAGTFVAFGTAPGSTASDDPGETHGLFTKSLLKHFADLTDIERMFQQVRMDVVAGSHGAQVPWTSSSLIGTFHIDPNADLGAPDLPNLSTPQSTNLATSRSYIQRLEHKMELGGMESSSKTNETEMIAEALQQTRSLNLPKAISILTAVLAIDPRCSIALRLLGLAMHLTGRSLEGSRTLDRAIQLDPMDALAHAYRCLISADGSVSEEYCKKALTLDADLPLAHLGLAISSKVKNK